MAPGVGRRRSFAPYDARVSVNIGHLVWPCGAAVRLERLDLRSAARCGAETHVELACRRMRVATRSSPEGPEGAPSALVADSSGANLGRIFCPEYGFPFD
jgi:hypothetical protein